MDLFSLAAAAYHSGQWLQAEQICRRVVQAAPQYAPGWRLLGRVALQRREPDVAIVCWQRAMELDDHDVEACSELGTLLQDLGRLNEAVACHGRVARLLPASPEAQYNLGNALLKTGRVSEAITCFRQAVDLRPDFAAAHANLGAAWQQQGALDQATACCERAVALQPTDVRAHNNLGNALEQQGNHKAAAACYRRALQLAPDFADAHYNLGVALQSLHELDEAAASYRRALELTPSHAAALVNLGNVLREQQQHAEAVASYRRALDLSHDLAQAHNGLGITLLDLKQGDRAEECFRRAIELDPDFVDAYCNLGNALREQRRPAEALACYRHALATATAAATVHTNMGLTLIDEHRLDEAAECFRQALELDPDSAHAHYSLSFLLLLQGQFEQGWQEHEWRWQCAEFLRQAQEQQLVNLPQPMWDGSRLEGKTILLRGEQGLGDTLQFIRYAPVVTEYGGTVIVECSRPLLNILARCPGIDRLIGRGDALPPFDFHVPLLSLPAIFRTTLATIPSTVPYVFAEPKIVSSWRDRLAPLGGLRIGINWRGRPGQGVHRQRDIPLACFAGLAQLPGVRLISLQKGAGLADGEKMQADFPLVQLGDELDTAHGAFMDTAAIMLHLDLVITSDTSVAHLAGALGVPVWVALPYAPDWRWLLDRSDSPWYPTMRLFRQTKPGDWDDVFARIEAALN